jgi:hypothetical protein
MVIKFIPDGVNYVPNNAYHAVSAGCVENAYQ